MIPSNIFLIPFFYLERKSEKIAERLKQLEKDGVGLENEEYKKLMDQARLIAHDIIKYCNHIIYFAMNDEQKKRADVILGYTKDKKDFNKLEDIEYLEKIYEEFTGSIASNKKLFALAKNSAIDIPIVTAIIAAAIAALSAFRKFKKGNDNKKHNVISHIKHR